MTTDGGMTFDEAVTALQRAGNITKPRAEAIIRQQWRGPLPADPIAERDERVLEKAEQSKIVQLFRCAHLNVWNLSQSRAAKQTPGLPDLWWAHETRPLAGWWESKRQVDAELSRAQIEFRWDCLRAGVLHGFGDRYDAADFLISLGLTTREQLPPGFTCRT